MTATQTRASAPPAPSVLETLRALTPRRPLTPFEARRIAELHAIRLLELAAVTEPPVPSDHLAELLGVTAVTRPGLPTSGLATETNGGWVIVLSADDPAARRRFSYCHELKHIIDDPLIDRLYPPTYGVSAELRAERACDQFAAVLLMPRVWIKRDWGTGHQDVRRLAARYNVSISAMSVRLSGFGLRRIDIGHTRESLAYYTHHARRAAS